MRSESEDDDEEEPGEESVASGDEATNSEDEEDGATSNARPYLSLMRSLAEGAPKAKRRKLEHPTVGDEPEQQIQEDGVDEESPDSVDPTEELEEEDDDEETRPEDLFDEDDDLDSSDPFEVHFANPAEEGLSEKLKAIQDGQWQLTRVSSNPWRLFLNSPKTDAPINVALPKPNSGAVDLKLKRKLQEVAASQKPEFNALEGLLSSFMFNHLDTLFCERTVANSASLRWMASLHALNHVFK